MFLSFAVTSLSAIAITRNCSECSLYGLYEKSGDFFINNDKAALNELYDMLELHESYLVEMRRNILHKINKLNKQDSAISEK